MKNKQPKHLILLKILWFVITMLGLVSIIIFFSFNSSNIKPVITIFIVIGMVAFPCASLLILPYAFRPEIDKLKIKRELYSLEKREEIEEEIMSTEAEIDYVAIKNTTRAVKEGIKSSYCAFCGEPIKDKSNFCDKCGKAIYVKCSECKTLNSSDSSFCKKCGTKLENE